MLNHVLEVVEREHASLLVDLLSFVVDVIFISVRQPISTCDLGSSWVVAVAILWAESVFFNELVCIHWNLLNSQKRQISWRSSFDNKSDYFVAVLEQLQGSEQSHVSWSDDTNVLKVLEWSKTADERRDLMMCVSWSQRNSSSTMTIVVKDSLTSDNLFIKSDTTFSAWSQSSFKS